ncbi:MAG: phage portal protein [Rhodospirillaceae bacterium TMED8]|nr:MAG: phage portal protein [Rhodospirillaceae bacterium TMED8]
MAWYNKIFNREEKLNPAQPLIARDEGLTLGTTENFTHYANAYEQLEIVNRAVNMIVDDSSEIPVDVGDKLALEPIYKNIRKSRVNLLLNQEPNPFQDVSTFKRNLVIDLLIDGNIFIYFDGVHLYQLPARNVDIDTDEKTYINGYIYQGKVQYNPQEVIHIKENSFKSMYRGVPRLKPAWRTMKVLGSMRNFQDNFFKNGAVPGLVIKSPNTLSEKIKERMLAAWRARYNPEAGGRRPLILDGGLELDTLSNTSFKELDFADSIKANENIILQALGVPPILLDSGNNANIRPNHRMYYLETILPIVRKINFAFERYFGFDLQENTSNIPAMQPELRDQAGYYSSLVNGGVMTPNEARVQMRLDPLDGLDEIRVPANIAGSASNPSEGGRPEEDEGEE